MAYLKIGEKAPNFKVINQDGEMVGLDDFKERKVILYFYPKANTPGCTAESCNLRDNYNNLLGRGYDIIGVSPDKQEKQK